MVNQNIAHGGGGLVPPMPKSVWNALATMQVLRQLATMQVLRQLATMQALRQLATMQVLH